MTATDALSAGAGNTDCEFASVHIASPDNARRDEHERLNLVSSLFKRTYGNTTIMKTCETEEHFKTIAAAHPTIGQQIAAAWGKPEFQTLMQTLEVNTRDRLRDGFSAEVFFALQGLANLHDTEFPKLAPIRPLL